MSKTVNEMRAYIERNPAGDLAARYDMTLGELVALLNMSDVGEAIGLAFAYGRAKGVRMQKGQARKQRQRGPAANGG